MDLIPWVIVFIGILAAIYTLKLIKTERTTFLDECYFISIKGITFPIPDWWTLTKESDTFVSFHRSDTRYDWRAKYKYVLHDKKTPLITILENYQDELKLVFDEDVIIETKSQNIIKDQEFAKKFYEVIRVEGKATKDNIDRLYIDFYLIRLEQETNYFLFESISSVLNGLVEGPYFEESIYLMSEEQEKNA